MGRSPGEASPGLFRVLWWGCGQHSRHYHLGDWKFLSESGTRVFTNSFEFFLLFLSVCWERARGGEPLVQSTVYRVPGFLSSRPNWLSSPPHRKRVFPPRPPSRFQRGDTLACGREGEGAHSNEGTNTLYSYSTIPIRNLHLPVPLSVVVLLSLCVKTSLLSYVPRCLFV